MKRILTWFKKYQGELATASAVFILTQLLFSACQPVQAEKEEVKPKTPTYKVTWYHENSGSDRWTATNIQYIYESGVRFTTDRGKTVWVFGQVSIEEE